MSTASRRPSALALGSAASGVLAYVFFALVTRALGSAGAAPVSILWSWWSFAGAALTFPVQHWVARSVTAHAGELAVRRGVASLARAALAVAVVVLVATWPFRERLFHSGSWWFPALAAAVALMAGAMGLVRGLLSGRHRFGAVAAALLLENLVRAVLAAVLLAAGVDDPVAYGLCLLAGYATVLVWPSALRPGTTGTPPDPDEHGSPLAFVGGAGAAQVVGQAVLTGGPVVLAVLGGSAAAVTALFAGLALFRAPYTLLLGAVAQLTGALTGLVVAGRHADLTRVRRGLAAAGGAGSLLAAAVGWLLGPALVRLVFGGGIDLARGTAVLLAVGSALAMANLLVTVLVLARGRVAHLVRSWLVALVPGAVVLAAAWTDPVDRTALAFVLVEAAALVLLVRADGVAAREAAAA
ncbi:MAG: hypothetical protein ACXVEJ_06235 [Nocardioides sp.]